LVDRGRRILVDVTGMVYLVLTSGYNLWPIMMIDLYGDEAFYITRVDFTN